MRKYFFIYSALFFFVAGSIYLVQLKYNINLYRLKLVLHIIYNISVLIVLFYRKKLQLTRSDIMLISLLIFVSMTNIIR